MNNIQPNNNTQYTFPTSNLAENFNINTNINTFNHFKKNHSKKNSNPFDMPITRFSTQQDLPKKSGDKINVSNSKSSFNHEKKKNITLHISDDLVNNIKRTNLYLNTLQLQKNHNQLGKIPTNHIELQKALYNN